VGKVGKMVFPYVSLMTSAIPRYTALNPHTIPSYPVSVAMVAFPVSSRIVRSKKRTARLANTNWRLLFVLRVPSSMQNVKSPHMKKYAAKACGVGPLIGEAPATLKNESLGKTKIATNDHQKSPYDVNATVPKVFPFLNSIVPTIICASPP